MATPHSTATEGYDQLRNITDCNICCEAFRDPRTLPCFHTFCLSCIRQAGTKANERSGDKMPCPVCRKEFIIPTSGFEELQKNFFIQRIIEMRELLERTSGQIPCDTCNDETINESNAVAITARYCLECNLNLCEQCCAHHRRSRLSREHTLREGASLTNVRESEEAPQMKTCLRHTDEEMKLYCETCSEVLCPMCFIENHQGHERLSVVEAGDEFRIEIQVAINEIYECTSKATIKKELIEREMDRITKRTEGLEQQVMKRRDDLKEIVDKHAELLLEQLRTRECEKLKETAVQNDESEVHLVSLESFKNYSSSFVAYATNGEIYKTVSDLNRRATELRKENEATVQRQLSPYQLSFTATTLDKFSNLVENIIGKIEDIEDLELMSEESAIDENTDTSQSERHVPNTIGKKESRQNPVLLQTLKTDIAEEGNRPIWGVTSLNNELYIVKKGSSQVEVYDLTSLSFTRKWYLNKLRDPQDIASCAKEKCLYVMDWNQAMISRVDPNGLFITEWSVAEGGGRLSVTYESNVLLTAYKQNKLSEYRADGRLICQVKLSSIVHPQHALKLANGGFVVSHGVVTDPLNRVCVVDGRGKILKSFGGKPGSTAGKVNHPLHLAVNSEGSILVADWNNSRVLLLNSQLEFKKELLSKRDGLRHPGRICLNESNGQLIVADNFNGWSDGQVHIFDI